MNEKRILESALEYLRRGWSVIPVNRKKKPALRTWKAYQEKAPTEAQVKQWFKRNPTPNIGIVLGPVSGYLLCCDFDKAEAYERWKASNPELADTLPTVRTGRAGGGYHVYFRFEGRSRQHRFPSGELKGKGYFAVAPLSVHESGAVYESIVPFGDDVPTVEPDRFEPFLGPLGEQPCATESSELPESSESPELQELQECRLSPHSVGPRILSNGQISRAPVSLEDAIEITLPTEPGMRNDLVFSFLRALQALPQYAAADPSDLRDEFDQWYERAEPFLGTQDKEFNWGEFVRSWKDVIVPMGAGSLEHILEAAKQRTPPPVLADTGNDKLCLLANICAELQERAGESVFYLDVRKAGNLIGLHWTSASRYFHALVGHKLLKCRQKAIKGVRAARYQYLGELNEGTEG